MANPRRPPLTARMADVLDRAAWALEVLVPELPHVERTSAQPTFPLSTREALTPPAERLAGEARALAAEYRRRNPYHGAPPPSGASGPHDDPMRQSRDRHGSPSPRRR